MEQTKKNICATYVCLEQESLNSFFNDITSTFKGLFYAFYIQALDMQKHSFQSELNVKFHLL